MSETINDGKYKKHFKNVYQSQNLDAHRQILNQYIDSYDTNKSKIYKTPKQENQKLVKKENITIVKYKGSFPYEYDSKSFKRFLDFISNSTPNKDLVEANLLPQILGRNILYLSPFSKSLGSDIQLLKLYCDYTASGQDLHFLTHYMKEIEELYANTHTEISYTGGYMNTQLHQSIDLIMNCLKADQKWYTLIPCGSGVTGALEFLQKVLGTLIPAATLKEVFSVENHQDLVEFKKEAREAGRLPLVIISSYEHHSNEITWRQQMCDVRKIPLDQDGFMDYNELNSILTESKGTYAKVIICVSAGSNLTGVLTDYEYVATISKQHEALCFFDFAGVGPYVNLSLNHYFTKFGISEPTIDGVFLSPHKFLGGPATAGMLIMRKSVYDLTLPPTHGGGGTVDFVAPESAARVLPNVVYSKDILARESSGTPGIMQVIKASTAISLKTKLAEYINKREEELQSKFFDKFGKDDRFSFPGPTDRTRCVPIISFSIVHSHFSEGVSRFYHYNFISKLLNDLFGIQSRSGCFCAGPYGHFLTKTSDENSQLVQDLISSKEESTPDLMAFKLGWTRINLHWTMTDSEFKYVCDALDLLADHAFKFLPVYKLDIESGSYQHKDVEKDPLSKRFSIRNFDELRSYAMDEKSRNEIMKANIKTVKFKIIPEVSKMKLKLYTFPELGNLNFFFAHVGTFNEEIYFKKLKLINFKVNKYNLKDRFISPGSDM